VRARRLAAAVLTAAGATLAAGGAAAEGPPSSFVNARVERRSAAGGLEAALQAVHGAGGPVWVAYAAAMDAPRSMCCWTSVSSIERTRGPGCRLEDRKGSFTMGSGAGQADLEADRTMLVLARRQAGATTRIRVLSWSCAVDAGNLPLVWLDGVTPADSVRFLDGVVREARTGQELIDSALMALASHAEPSAVEALIGAARRERRHQVRSQALFWLSQKAGRRATETIARAVDEDPESDVRARAVFALSQLPHDEGVPRLIELARSHRDPNVREKAMFWLGQSGDDRALAFFEQVLAR
jgi:hypothetical protein